MRFIINLIHTVLSLYSLALVGRIFFEMLLGPHHSVVVFLRRITEPLLAPIRRFVPPVRSGNVAWDLSPMIALLFLWAVEQLLVRVLAGILTSVVGY